MEDPEKRKAILGREAEELKTLLAGRVGVSVEASSSAGLRSLGGGDSAQDKIDSTLKTDILGELKKITANTGKPALTT